MNPPNKSMKHDKKGVNYSTKGKRQINFPSFISYSG